MRRGPLLTRQPGAARSAVLGLAVALGLVSPSAAQQAGWGEGPLSAAEAAGLFERACLATLPDFAGANPLFAQLGFMPRAGMLMRNHPGRNVSAMAMAGDDTDPGGARSCAIIAGGLGQKAAERAVEPLVLRRFGGTATRHHNAALGVDHVVWTREAPDMLTKIIVTESDSAAFLGITLVPRRAAAPQ